MNISCYLYSSGEDLETDFIFTCIGSKTRKDLTSATTLDLNERGQVKVDKTDLHVIGEKALNLVNESFSSLGYKSLVLT